MVKEKVELKRFMLKAELYMNGQRLESNNCSSSCESPCFYSSHNEVHTLWIDDDVIIDRWYSLLVPGVLRLELGKRQAAIFKIKDGYKLNRDSEVLLRAIPKESLSRRHSYWLYNIKKNILSSEGYHEPTVIHHIPYEFWHVENSYLEEYNASTVRKILEVLDESAGAIAISEKKQEIHPHDIAIVEAP